MEHLAKYRSLMPSLALLFHLLAVAADPVRTPRQIQGVHAVQAAAWVGFLEEHARRIYELVTHRAPRAAASLSRKLTKRQLPNPFTIRDVYRKNWTGLTDKDTIQDGVDLLVDLGWIRESSTPTGPGYRGRVEYSTNPKVLA